jgi:hypothetical protein
LLPRALHAVDEDDGGAFRAHAQRAWRFARRQAVTAGSGIDLGAIRGEAERRVGDLAAGAAAPVGAALQTLQGGCVTVAAQALIDDRAVPGQPEPFERAQDGVGRARLHARRIEIFDAHDPAAARRTRV